MDLYSGAPYWLSANEPTELSATPPPHIEVAVIGAGITGALVADALTERGAAVLLVDKRTPAAGSTAACTALLQYEIDQELLPLGDRIGPARAARAYRLCHDAIDSLATIAESLGGLGFARRPCLYLASTRRDARRLPDEAAARQRAGFAVEFWPAARVREVYGFPGHGALKSVQAGVVDPVRLTRALLGRAVGRGAGLATRTQVCEVRAAGNRFLVTTDRDRYKADRVVFAMGYEVPPALRSDLVTLTSTYALVTQPVTDFGSWSDECLVWETARPYSYLRTVEGGRIAIGGMDLPFVDPLERDRRMARQIRRLERRLAQLLPSVSARTDFRWAGTFADTADGLPFIGPVPDLPGAFAALGYGGNGITFSIVAAAVLRDLCIGLPNVDAELFRLDR